MARIIKEHDVRRDEILEVAQRLFYQKGYEQTSVQEVTAAVGIAKGTFYHYFASKVDLLDEMIQRMIEQTTQAAKVIVDDPDLNAIEKFQRFFSDIEGWKVERKTFFIGILRTYYSDENAILRQKLMAASTQIVAPMFARIIHQGIAEGVFVTEYPGEIAEIVLTLTKALAEEIALMLLRDGQDPQALLAAQTKAAAHCYAIERLLGAPRGSIHIFDSVSQWFG